jgi:hypothetical protein
MSNSHCKVTDFWDKATETHSSTILRYAQFPGLSVCGSSHRWLILQLCLIVKLWYSWRTSGCGLSCGITALSVLYFLSCCCNLQVCDCTVHSQFSCTSCCFAYLHWCLTKVLLQKVLWCHISKYHLHSRWLYNFLSVWSFFRVEYLWQVYWSCVSFSYIWNKLWLLQFFLQCTEYWNNLNTHGSKSDLIHRSYTYMWCHLNSVYGSMQKCVYVKPIVESRQANICLTRFLLRMQ